MESRAERRLAAPTEKDRHVGRSANRVLDVMLHSLSSMFLAGQYHQ